MSKVDFKTMQNLTLVTQIGLVMIIPIFGGVYIGNYLDIRFGTNGVCLLIFTIFGVIVAFLNLFKMVLRKSKNKDRK